MVLVCFFSFFLSAFSLALIVGIMRGFETTTTQSLQSIHPQIIIESSNGNPLHTKKIQAILKEEFPEIKHSTFYDIQHGLVKAESTTDPHLVLLQGVDPETISHVISLKKKLVNPFKKPIKEILENNHIIIGKKLADLLDVQTQDPIDILFSPEYETQQNKLILDKKKCVVNGILNTGIDEFDSGLIFMSLEMLQDLFPNAGPRTCALQLQKNANEEETMWRLRKRFNLPTYSWKELYPSVLEALTLEKYGMILILSLLVLIACMNNISLLYMFISYKNKDIAILKAMGASNMQLIQIFRYLALTIAVVSSLCGLLAAYGVSLFLRSYPIITLPDVYFVRTIPVDMNFFNMISIFFFIIFSSLFAAFIPLRTVKSYSIIQLLRNQI